MQYQSTTCASFDIQFECEIQRILNFVPSVLANIIASYGRNLTDNEKLRYILESCKSNCLVIFSSNNVNDAFQEFKITWQDSPSDFMRKKYKLEISSKKIHLNHDIYFIDLLPYGRAGSIAVSYFYNNCHDEYKIREKFSTAMTKLFANYQDSRDVNNKTFFELKWFPIALQSSRILL